MKSRLQELKNLYSKVFNGQIDYIPMIVNPPCPQAPTVDELWKDLPAAIAKTSRALKPKADIGSDWIPTLNIGLYQCIAIPSLFEAKIVKLDGSEPLCYPCFSSIDNALEAGIPTVQSNIIDRMLKELRIAKKSLTEQGYALSFPVTASPFDLAQLMCGDEFLLSLIASPEKAMNFLINLSHLAIDIINVVKSEMGQPNNEYITNRGIFFEGLRLPCDAIVNYSPDLVRNFVVPILKKFSDSFAKLCIHFCTEPAPSEHVLPVLCETDFVAAVDNWQGPDVFIGDKAPSKMQNKIAIVSSLDLAVPEKIDAFLEQSPVKNVPRRGGRGLVVATEAESIDHGKRIFEQWNKKLDRNK